MLEGSAPAGATLRLTKAVQDRDVPAAARRQAAPGRRQARDRLRRRLRRPRPLARQPLDAADRGQGDRRARTPARRARRRPARAASTGNDGRSRQRRRRARREPDANSNDPAHYNDHPITIPATGDNASMSVRVSWTSLASDWDVKLYEDTNGDGKSQDDEPVVSTSQTGPSNIEEVSAHGTPRLQAGKKYVLRVNNFARGRELRRRHHLRGAAAVQAGAGGELHAHVRAGRARVRDPAGPDRPRPGQAARPERMRARHRGRRPRPTAAPASTGDPPPVRLRRDPALREGDRRRARRAVAFSKRVSQRVNVDVFQVTAGRKVIGERLVARFRNKARSFTWNGRSKGKRVKPGFFFARYSIRLPNGQSRRPPQGAAPQGRALHRAARLLPPRHLRAAALLQARARRVRRQHAAPAARRVPPHPRGAPCACRCCAGRRSSRRWSGPSASRPAARTARACARRACARATTRCGSRVRRAGSRTTTSTLTTRKL